MRNKPTWAHVIPVALIAVFAWCAYGWLSRGIDAMRASEFGIPGTVVATECEPFRKASTCEGVFRSDDGKVVIDRVAFHPEVRQWPMDPLRLTVSSPSAPFAHPEGEWWVQVGSGLFFAAMVLLVVRWHLR